MSQLIQRTPMIYYSKVPLHIEYNQVVLFPNLSVINILQMNQTNWYCHVSRTHHITVLYAINKMLIELAKCRSLLQVIQLRQLLPMNQRVLLMIVLQQTYCQLVFEDLVYYLMNPQCVIVCNRNMGKYATILCKWNWGLQLSTFHLKSINMCF